MAEPRETDIPDRRIAIEAQLAARLARNRDTGSKALRAMAIKDGETVAGRTPKQATDLADHRLGVEGVEVPSEKTHRLQTVADELTERSLRPRTDQLDVGGSNSRRQPDPSRRQPPPNRRANQLNRRHV